MLPSEKPGKSIRLIVYSFALVGIVSGFICKDGLPFWLFATINGFFYVSLYLLFRCSSFRYTRFFRMMLICFALFLVGLCGKIQHWAIGIPFLLIGMFGAGIVYTIRFYFKPRRRTIDYLKLIWFLSAIFIGAGTLLHFFSKEWKQFPNLLYGILLVYVIRDMLMAKSNQSL